MMTETMNTWMRRATLLVSTGALSACMMGTYTGEGENSRGSLVSGVMESDGTNTSVRFISDSGAACSGRTPSKSTGVESVYLFCDTGESGNGTLRTDSGMQTSVLRYKLIGGEQGFVRFSTAPSPETIQASQEIGYALGQALAGGGGGYTPSPRPYECQTYGSDGYYRTRCR